MPEDLLIVDDCKSFKIENLGDDRFTGLEICVNKVLVAGYVAQFEDWWAIASDATHFLPPAARP
jgi:hypothetical protein